MTIYKCDKCGKTFSFKNDKSVYILDKNGIKTDTTADLCQECEEEFRRITTEFLYGNGSYEKRKANHDYVMSYAM